MQRRSTTSTKVVAQAAAARGRSGGKRAPPKQHSTTPSSPIELPSKHASTKASHQPTRKPAGITKAKRPRPKKAVRVVKEQLFLQDELARYCGYSYPSAQWGAFTEERRKTLIEKRAFLMEHIQAWQEHQARVGYKIDTAYDRLMRDINDALQMGAAERTLYTGSSSTAPERESGAFTVVSDRFGTVDEKLWELLRAQQAAATTPHAPAGDASNGDVVSEQPNYADDDDDDDDDRVSVSSCDTITFSSRHIDMVRHPGDYDEYEVAPDYTPDWVRYEKPRSVVDALRLESAEDIQRLLRNEPVGMERRAILRAEIRALALRIDKARQFKHTKEDTLAMIERVRTGIRKYRARQEVVRLARLRSAPKPMAIKPVAPCAPQLSQEYLSLPEEQRPLKHIHEAFGTCTDKLRLFRGIHCTEYASEDRIRMVKEFAARGGTVRRAKNRERRRLMRLFIRSRLSMRRQQRNPVREQQRQQQMERLRKKVEAEKEAKILQKRQLEEASIPDDYKARRVEILRAMNKTNIDERRVMREHKLPRLLQQPRPFIYLVSRSIGRSRTELDRIARDVFTCPICLDDVQAAPPPDVEQAPAGVMLSCGEVYCRDCLRKHIETKLLGYALFYPLHCPGSSCTVPINRRAAFTVLSPTMMQRFIQRQVNDSIENKLYCPNERCSQPLSLDNRDWTGLRLVACPLCKTHICLPCKVKEHTGKSCEEFLALPLAEKHRNDHKTLKMIKGTDWRRCPRCELAVDLHHGCNHITCTCGNEFCFQCGWQWDRARNKCSNPKSCLLWEENRLMLHQNPAQERLRARAAKRAAERATRMQFPKEKHITRNFELNLVRTMQEVAVRSKIVNRWMFEHVRINRCGYCRLCFKSPHGLEMHLTHTVRHPVHHCKGCDQIFPSIRILDCHLASTQCKQDRAPVSTRSALRDFDIYGQYKMRAAGVGRMTDWMYDGLCNTTCKYCRGTFASLEALKQHLIEADHPVYYCCQKLFEHYKPMHMHQLTPSCQLHPEYTGPAPVSEDKKRKRKKRSEKYAKELRKRQRAVLDFRNPQ